MPAVSIIIPVYKAEKYLCRCLDSILMQTFQDFEILLIDDGSPDKSGEICDEYAAKDIRIKVIHKQNGGVSSARQCGIEYATGEYTIHVDSDDWIETNMLDELYRVAKHEKADMVICDYYEDRGSEICYKKQRPTNCTPYQVIYDLFQRLHGSCCNKLIKSTCYREHSVHFPVGINIMEDKVFVIQTSYFMHKIVYLDKAFYHYNRTNEISITHGSSNFSNIGLAIYDIYADFYKKYHITDKLLLEGLRLYRIISLSAVALYGRSDEQHIKYNKYCNLLPHIHKLKNLSWSHKLALYFRILGLDFMIPIMLRYKYLRKSNN